MRNLAKKETHMMLQSLSYKDMFDAILCMEQDKYRDAPGYVRDAIYEAWMERFDTTGFLDMDILHSIEIDLGIDQTINWQSQQKRVFVDMDGTIAEFKPCKTMEKLYEKGYFASLLPIENTVEAVRQYIEKYPDTEVFVLSACLSDSKYAQEEKNAWLNQYLPEIDEKHRIFPPCGEDKTLYISGGVKEPDILLDDYSVNLFQWQKAGGKAVKLMNGINGTKGKWQGAKVFAGESPEKLCEDLRRHVQRSLPERRQGLSK
ncbi:hypothetical protein ACDL92_11965 [Ihubacter sp. mB4P-1]|uniref:5' nucleotidase, NT5C type n=1 Tax=Ihubacter sp. mB4P-1 TaxID=3242370 RepID=UPI003C7EB7F6